MEGDKKSMGRIDVVGVGALNMDHYHIVQSVSHDDETTVAISRQLPGGSSANTIYALGKLGVTTGFVGAIGDDLPGKALLDDLASVRTDVEHVKIKRGHSTGSTLCLIDGAGQRALYVSPGANSLLAEEDVD